jgi:N-acylneuraminate cytidylyltransferase/CMP-N,N'-diacetyllegionaminic acid synthase
MNILCTICARGGSKGVPGKNTIDVSGKPLIAHTIKQALSSRITEDILVTSDSRDILAIAEKLMVPHIVLRPSELAHDTADKLDAIRHAVDFVEGQTGKRFSIIVDLDPTSPLRNIEDISAALEMFKNSNANNLITGAPSRRSPYFNLVEVDQSGYVKLSKPSLSRIIRRQESPKCYDMNASIYIWRRDFLMSNKVIFSPKTILYEMPEERSIDVDSQLDLKIVRMLMAEKYKQNFNE